MQFLPGEGGQALSQHAFSLGIAAILLFLVLNVFGNRIAQIVQSIFDQLQL